jgi:predicted nucleic acid-binding protein
LFASPQLHLLSESPGYFEKLREVATAARLKGPRIHDARIAALCLHHGVSELRSANRDFSAFP